MVGGIFHGAFLLVDEVTAGSVRTVSELVESATCLSLVFGVSVETAQLALAVRKLTLAAVFAVAVLLEAPAQFGLVPVRGQARQRRKSGWWRDVVGIHPVEGGQAAVGQTHGSVWFKGVLGFTGRSVAPGVFRPAAEVVGEPLGADALRGEWTG